MDPVIMQTFYQLADSKEDCLSATSTLVGRLKEEKSSDALTYTWQRLVKGMASNRKNARHGFAVALTEVLSLHPDLDTKEIYKYIKENSLPSASVSHKETRDLYAGYVFCNSALHRSGRTKDVDVSLDILKDMLPILIKSKLTIKDAVFKVYMEILADINDEDIPKIIEILNDELIKGWNNCCPERLALASYLEKRAPSSMGKIIKKHWNFSHIHHPQNYDNVGEVLRKTICEERVKPQLNLIIECCMSAQNFKLKKALKTFTKMSECGENKITVVYTLMKIVDHVSDDKLEMLLSKHLMQFLVKTRFNSPASVQKLSECFSKKVLAIDDKELKVKLATQMFDASPKGSSFLHTCLNSVINSINPNDASGLIQHMMAAFSQPPAQLVEAKVVCEYRKDCLTWLIQILKSADQKQLFDFTKFLFIYSHFEVHGQSKENQFVTSPKPEQDTATTDFCKVKLNSCLKVLASQTSEGDSKRKGLASDKRYWVYHLMNTSLSLITDENFTLRNDVTNSDEWRTLWTAIDEIAAKQPDSRNDEDWAFELLFLHCGILFFEEEEQAKVLMTDVYQCYEKCKGDSGSAWMEVLVDLLISILSYESQMLRSIASECFKAICNNMGENCVELIMSVLETKKGEDEDAVEEMEEGSDDEAESGSDEDDDEDDDEEDESDSGEEEIESSEDEDEAESDEDEASEMESEGKQKSCEEESECCKKPEGCMKDETAVEMEENKDSDDDVALSDADEEQLKKDDKALTAAMKVVLALKQQTKSKKKAKTLKKVKSVQFKVKILDFVEVLIKELGLTGPTVAIVPRLLKLISGLSQKSDPIQERGFNILRSLVNTKQENLKVDMKLAEEKAIPQIQESVIKMQNKNVRQLAVQILFCFGKTIMSAEEPAKKKAKLNDQSKSKAESLFGIFKPLIQDFLSNKNTRQNKDVFFQVIERFPIIRPLMVSELVAYSKQDGSVYSKMQAVALLQRVLCFTDESVLKLSSNILDAAGHIIEIVNKNESPSPHHLRECLKLCTKLSTSFSKNSSSPPALSKDTKAAVESIFTCETAIRFPDLSNLAKKVISSFN